MSPTTSDSPAYRVPVISLFSGAGGLDLGFQDAGFQTLVAVDHDEASLQTYSANISCGAVLRADLGKIRRAKLLATIEQHGIPRGIIGGPPCQGFSRGNVARDPNDARNKLPYQFMRVLRIAQEVAEVDFFVFENVPGLLQPRHQNLWSNLVERFERLGFTLHYGELNAADFGVPQVRRRLFLVGLRTSLGETDYSLPRKRMRKFRSVAQAIQGLPEPAYFQRDLEPGQILHHANHWTMQPRSTKFSTKNFNRWRSFRRLDWDQPSPTVAYGNREVHVHPDGHRRLSVYEAMLLQGFPKRFVFCGNLSEQFQQVSNAVPPPLAKGVARSIMEVLSK